MVISRMPESEWVIKLSNLYDAFCYQFLQYFSYNFTTSVLNIMFYIWNFENNQFTRLMVMKFTAKSYFFAEGPKGLVLLLYPYTDTAKWNIFGPSAFSTNLFYRRPYCLLGVLVTITWSLGLVTPAVIGQSGGITKLPPTGRSFASFRDVPVFSKKIMFSTFFS